MGNQVQELQLQRTIHDLKKEVEQLRHELTVQNHLHRIMTGAIVGCVNKISPKENVYEVLLSVIDELSGQLGGKSKALDEAVTEAKKMVTRL